MAKYLEYPKSSRSSAPIDGLYRIRKERQKRLAKAAELRILSKLKKEQSDEVQEDKSK